MNSYDSVEGLIENPRWNNDFENKGRCGISYRKYVPDSWEAIFIVTDPLCRIKTTQRESSSS
jgi:hypothetical protein